jgi:DNA mismatch repair protein MutS
MTVQKLTPLMQQYWDIKNQHLDKILLFRMGDFYEMFFDDAVKSAPILNIALTSRNKSQGNDVPMCGVPHHSIGPQINKLLKAGLKVAICDQVENPKDAKTIVKRAVVRVVTPGLAYDPETISGHQSLFVASFRSHENSSELFELAAIDASTGEVVLARELSLSELSSWLQKLSPQEFIFNENFKPPFIIEGLITKRPHLQNQTIEDYLLSYVAETQGSEILKTLMPARTLETKFLKLSPTTIRHLEIFKTSSGDDFGSLFDTLNFTKSAMGSRFFKKRLASPFVDLNEINRELNQVEKFLNDSDLRQNIRERFSKIGDLERRVAKLSNPLCNARDLQTLGRSLKIAGEILTFINEEKFLPKINKIATLIESRLQDELPHSVKEGSLIRPNVNSALDEFVELATHAQTKLTELEEREKLKSGISSLKIKYNSVFGYSIEITKANLTKVPLHFIRRQTLANAERFVTPELVELEEKILSSRQKRQDLEFQIFSEIKDICLSEARELLELASYLAVIDVRASLAQLAFEQNYCRPEFSINDQNDGDTKALKLSLKNSRHPVLERISRELFVSNDIELLQSECVLLTGPNMAGKSTLMRQVALTALLAQVGSFVPASTACLPLFDQIFTRIGASDHLVKGLSTFMVEMTETAEIINAATNQSLVILDEIGRGTSTYDGMSLAQAVLEYFVNEIKSYTFFATHYHELIELEKELPSLSNYHMSIEEHKGRLIFLRKLTRGSASRSYGIEVAKEAGLPTELTKRAQVILKGITSKTRELKNRQMDLMSHAVEAVPSIENERELLINKERVDHLENLASEVKKVPINQLTPLEALNHLASLQKYLV